MLAAASPNRTPEAPEVTLPLAPKPVPGWPAPLRHVLCPPTLPGSPSCPLTADAPSQRASFLHPEGPRPGPPRVGLLPLRVSQAEVRPLPPARTRAPEPHAGRPPRRLGAQQAGPPDCTGPRSRRPPPPQAGCRRPVSSQPGAARSHPCKQRSARTGDAPATAAAGPQCPPPGSTWAFSPSPLLGPRGPRPLSPTHRSHEDNRYRLCTRAQSGPGPSLLPTCVTSLRRGGFSSSRSARRQGSLCCHENRTVPRGSVLARSPTRGALHRGHRCVSDTRQNGQAAVSTAGAGRSRLAAPSPGPAPRRPAGRSGEEEAGPAWSEAVRRPRAAGKAAAVLLEHFCRQVSEHSPAESKSSSRKTPQEELNHRPTDSADRRLLTSSPGT